LEGRTRTARRPDEPDLVAVAGVSLVLGETSTAILVGALVLLNVVLGARQELAALGAVAVTMVIGKVRGLEFNQLLLLGTAMAISAIPTGLPTFVQAMLANGSKKLSEAKAVVRNLTDVETLGSTSAINTDKTGTLTMNEMMVRLVYTNRQWMTVEGSGYDKNGAILGVAGAPPG